MKIGRVALLLATAFTVGGASAEVAVRTHRAVAQETQQRELGAAGQLVALELASSDGEVLATPRLIAPAGKAAELVLHDPSGTGGVRLAFRVEAERQPTGEICLDYELWVPGHDVATRGSVSLEPGVQQSIKLPDGELVATWLAVPVPSKAFDQYLELYRAQRRQDGKQT